MGFSVNTNLDALNTYKNLSGVQNSLSNSLAKLSSGLRINNAGDDAAGLTIATQLGSQVSGLTQASRNAQDGVSVVQTADGALSQAQSLLGRLRDLAVQAGNDSNSTSARTAISTEATSITAELQRLGQSVNFNGKNLLDGTAGTLKFQVGADGNSQSQITVDLGSANLLSTAATLGSVTTTGWTRGTSDSGTTLHTGANVFTSTQYAADGTTVLSTSSATVNVSASVPAAASASDQVAALNANAQFASNFRAVVTYSNTGVATGVGVVAKDGGTVTAAVSGGSAIATSGASFGALDFSNATGAQSAIGAIDTALSNVSSARASIGALENRFASAQSTIATSITNLTAAKSRITDVDMASEMVNYSRANILSQSGTAMLAQANSLPQLALKLLG